MLKHTSWDFLAKEHGLKQCQSKDTCRVDSCRKRHHTLLYETKKVIASQSTVAEEEVAQNNSTQSTAIQSKIYKPLQVLPVILSNNSYSVRTNALLDCGVSSTLVREDIAKILQLKGKQKPLKIQNVFLDSGQTELKLVNFKISSNHHPEKIQITKAWSIPNLPMPHVRYSTQKLQKRYQQFQGIDIPSISSSDITVLIGADMPKLLIHKEYKAEKENEPYAVRTKLGCVLTGGKSSKSEKSVTNNACRVHSIDEVNLEQFGTSKTMKCCQKMIQKL